MVICQFCDLKNSEILSQKLCIRENSTYGIFVMTSNGSTSRTFVATEKDVESTCFTELLSHCHFEQLKPK